MSIAGFYEYQFQHASTLSDMKKIVKHTYFCFARIVNFSLSCLYQSLPLVLFCYCNDSIKALRAEACEETPGEL